jgi:hypothetical protein
MAKTVADVQLSLAYRLGESSSPSNATELARRQSYIKQAVEFVTLDKPYWFMRVKLTDDTVEDQEAYAFPDRVFAIDEIKVDGYQYQKVRRDEIYSKFEAPTAIVPILPSYMKRSYYLWGENYYLIPTPTADDTDNIELWCFQNPDLSSFTTTSSIVVPDKYEGMIAAYAEFRYWSAAHKRGKASDAESEFREYLHRLNQQDIRLRYGS